MADQDKGEMAEDRTDLAEDRTVLANERTLAGWIRTGLAAVGIGIAFNALFKTLEPVWAPKLIATGFLVLGVFIFASAERRACKVISRLSSHDVKKAGTMNVRLLTWSMIAGAIALIASLWFLREGASPGAL